MDVDVEIAEAAGLSEKAKNKCKESASQGTP